MRSFAAITVPDDIRKLYSKLCRGMRQGAEMSIVRPDKMHITLAFFNDLIQSQIEKVTKIMESLEQVRIEIRCTGIGKFSRRGIPSVVFVETKSDNLASLVAAFRKKLKAEGIPFDEKPFKAHLTIARIKEMTDINFFERMYRKASAEFQNSSFNADSVTLFSSDMITYKELFKKNLLPPETDADSTAEDSAQSNEKNTSINIDL